MARTDAETVRSLLADPDPDKDLTVFINIASRLVDQVEDCDTDNKLSAEVLADIEAYLAAHFYSLSDFSNTAKSEKTGDASITYGFMGGKGFHSSPYGEAALLLDFVGCLAAIQENSEGKVTGSIVWAGTTDDD